MSYKNAGDYGDLDKMICAAANELNGAFILIGVSNEMVVKGIQLEDEKKSSLKKIAKEKSSYLKPPMIQPLKIDFI